jgi:hypothetical protein
MLRSTLCMTKGVILRAGRGIRTRRRRVADALLDGVHDEGAFEVEA